jgi:hypothetical protein
MVLALSCKAICVGAYGDRHLGYVGTRALVPRRTSSRHDQNLKTASRSRRKAIRMSFGGLSVLTFGSGRDAPKLQTMVVASPPQVKSQQCKYLRWGTLVVAFDTRAV